MTRVQNDSLAERRGQERIAVAEVHLSGLLVISAACWAAADLDPWGSVLLLAGQCV